MHSTQYHPLYLRSFLILSSHLCLGLPSDSFLRFPHPKPVVFLFSSYVPYDSPTSVSLTWHLNIWPQVHFKKILIVQFLLFIVNSLGQISSLAPFLCSSSVWVRDKVHIALWVRIFAYISLCLLRNLYKKNTIVNNDLQPNVLIQHYIHY